MRRSTRRGWIAAVAGGLVVVVLLGLLVLYARGGGPVPSWLGFLVPRNSDPLAASTPAETVLRTVRLAGFDQAAVGEQGGTVVVRLAIPQVRDPAVVEQSWQTALAAAALAYPRASNVVAQLFSGSTPLLQVTAEASAVRAAAQADDAAALRRAAKFRYLSSAGGTQ